MEAEDVISDSEGAVEVPQYGLSAAQGENFESNDDFLPAAEDEQEYVHQSESYQPEPEFAPPVPPAYFPEPEEQLYDYVPEPEPEASYGSFNLPEPEAVEENALQIFTREWNIKLDAKRAAEFEHEKAAREKARSDLANWTTQRDIRLNAKKDTNRSEQHIKVESIESEAENLKTWDRVTKLIDAGETVETTKGSDTTRMRKLFIQLKNEPLEVTRAASAITTN